MLRYYISMNHRTNVTQICINKTNPRLHLWIQKKAMEAIQDFTKYLSYIIIFKLTLGYPWATHKGSPRVAQEETIEYNR